MKQVENKYKCIPFWSWNDKLDEKTLCEQIDWMFSHGVGGFFMHARGGLKTEYLGKKWFDCIKACGEKAKQLDMEAYAYDENGWPSGFVGGKLLEEKEYHDRYLTCSFGDYDQNSLVSYDLSGDKLKRVKSGKNCLNVFEHYSTSSVDILNPEVVDKFLQLTHEQYKKQDDFGLKGFFTDEPQYYRWETPYTKVLAPFFKKEYGQDILEGLGLLFVEKEGYKSFRYKFWKSMQTLMLKNFAEKIYSWCDKNGYKLTGHYVEECSLGYQLMCCGGIMPFYEFEHIPGIDKLSRNPDDGLASKQLGSVASQLGKKQVLCEMFAACGWDVTPKELKLLAESMYVNGVNLMCQHLLPYTEHGQRKRDNPVHFSSVNPWVDKGFKSFNDYFSLLGKILSESKEIVNVGVLNPLSSCYFDYKRSPEPTFCVENIEKPYMEFLQKLTKMQIPHHIIDETILKNHGFVEDCFIKVGLCKYEYLIIPKIYTMEKSTEKILREYIKNGGKIFITDDNPSYLEGEKFNYDYLKSNISLEEIKDAQSVKSVYSESVRLTHRISDDGKEFYYLVNVGAPTDFELKTDNGKYFNSYDIFNDKYEVIDGKLHFNTGDSYLLYLTEDKPSEKKKLKNLYLDKNFEIVEKPENYLIMDFLKYSFDGVNYSESLHHMGVFNEMLLKRYKGDLYLKYQFNVKTVPNKCNLLIENTNLLDVSLNGEKLVKTGCSNVEKELYYFDCAKSIKVGLNQVVVKINYYQGENVYYALFGENVTETLKNCLAYDTDIEAIYLKGDFGVFGDFIKGKDDSVLLGDNFYIDCMPNKVSGLIKQGFPFFSGSIKLKQTIDVDNVNYQLVIDKRFHLIDVKVNGKYVNRLMFTNKTDLSKYLIIGKNEIEIDVSIGLRNFFGPFHTLEQENLNVGPYLFERLGTWKNGKSSILRENYSFVKSLID